jgi:hypothetical protein
MTKQTIEVLQQIKDAFQPALESSKRIAERGDADTLSQFYGGHQLALELVMHFIDVFVECGKCPKLV